MAKEYANQQPGTDQSSISQTTFLLTERDPNPRARQGVGSSSGDSHSGFNRRSKSVGLFFSWSSRQLGGHFRCVAA